MAFSLLSVPKWIHKTFSNLRTGVVLLISVGLASALGTFILQRPATDPEKLTRANSPATLQWLDRLGLTDVFHTWWFLTLLGLVSLSIVLVSIDRFPNACAFTPGLIARRIRTFAPLSSTRSSCQLATPKMVLTQPNGP